MARGIMRVMMSGAVAGCQADRARSVALGVVTGGGQSIPAALAAYLNPLLKEAGLTKPTAAHPSGGPGQYCSARDLISIFNFFIFMDLQKGTGGARIVRSRYHR